MEVIVEQLGTTNNVLERQKFDQHTIWLGRAFDNDVILNDEHADARHARLTVDEEGDLWIEDLDSINGIRRPRHKQHIERRRVESGDVFLIGRSRIRIFQATHPVKPAVRIRMSEVFLLWLGKPQVMISLALLYLASKVLGTYLGTIGEFRWSLVIERNLNEVTTFVALAVGVYFLSVLFRRGGNFLAHLSVLILVFLLSSVLEFGLGLAVFNAGDRWYGTLEVADSGRGYLMLFIYLWSILYLAFHISLLRRTLISLAIIAVMVGLGNLPEDRMTRFVVQQSFPVKQKFLPPSLLLRSPISPDDFAERNRELFGQVDELRVEALERREHQVIEEQDDPDPSPGTEPDGGSEESGLDDGDQVKPADVSGPVEETPPGDDSGGPDDSEGTDTPGSSA